MRYGFEDFSFIYTFFFLYIYMRVQTFLSYIAHAYSLFVKQNHHTMSRPKYTQKSINVEGHFYVNIIFWKDKKKKKMREKNRSTRRGGYCVALGLTRSW